VETKRLSVTLKFETEHHGKEILKKMITVVRTQTEIKNDWKGEFMLHEQREIKGERVYFLNHQKTTIPALQQRYGSAFTEQAISAIDGTGFAMSVEVREP